MLVLLNVHESAHDGFWIVNPLFSGDLLLVFSFLGAVINMHRFRHAKGTQEKNSPNSVFFAERNMDIKRGEYPIPGNPKTIFLNGTVWFVINNFRGLYF